MKMIGCNWKQLFCLLFTQSLIVISISSILVLSGIELLGNHMNFSLRGFAMTFTSETLFNTCFAIYRSSYHTLRPYMFVCFHSYSSYYRANRYLWKQ